MKIQDAECIMVLDVKNTEEANRKNFLRKNKIKYNWVQKELIFYGIDNFRKYIQLVPSDINRLKECILSYNFLDNKQKENFEFYLELKNIFHCKKVTKGPSSTPFKKDSDGKFLNELDFEKSAHQFLFYLDTKNPDTMKKFFEVFNINLKNLHKDRDLDILPPSFLRRIKKKFYFEKTR